jgi:hypothetical protein
MAFNVNLKEYGDCTFDNLYEAFEMSSSIYDRKPTDQDIYDLIDLSHKLYNRLPLSLTGKQIDDVVHRILHPENYED